MAVNVTIAADSYIFARSSGDKIANEVELVTLTAGRKATMSTSASTSTSGRINDGVGVGDGSNNGCTSVSSDRAVGRD